MIEQHQGKLTIAEIESISNDGTVLNNLYFSGRYPNLSLYRLRSLTDPLKFESPHGFNFGLLLGKPNCHMQGYEGYPGAWVFYDREYNVRWLIFSDAIRKNHFKGTSFEVTIPDEMSEELMKAAVRKLFNHFGYAPLNWDMNPL